MIEQILKEKKLKGLSWEKLAENLPITGDSLRISFSRGSVDAVYLEKLCETLEIEQSEQYVKNKESAYVDIFSEKSIQNSTLENKIDILIKQNIELNNKVEVLLVSIAQKNLIKELKE